MNVGIVNTRTICSLTGRPTVSVVVPFYGSDVSALLKCVASLLNQDYPEECLTIIIVDNNERPTLTDSMFEGRCKLVHEPSPGSYAARNRGVRESLGELIAFTDADCLAQRSWVSAGVKILVESAKPVMVGGPIVFSFRSSCRTTCELLDSIIHHRQTEYLFQHGFAATANFFIPRALICRYGPFDPRFLSGGDREFGQRLTAAGVGISMAHEAVVVHPARSRFMDLLQKGLRGVGGDKTTLNVKKSPRWLIFAMQTRNFFHRQSLISQQCRLHAITRYQHIKLGALLTFIYLVQFFEAIRLVFGGKPTRV